MESFLKNKFKMTDVITSNSVKQTLAAASKFAALLQPGDVIALSGDLGAGKTHFLKGAAKVFGIKYSNVVSPTFGILRSYKSKKYILHHFDFYRLNGIIELEKTGYRDCITDENAIVFIEWPEIIPETWKDYNYVITIKHKGNDNRKLNIYKINDKKNKSCVKINRVVTQKRPLRVSLKKGAK